MLSEVEHRRLAVARSCDRAEKSRLGQFFTPASIARFMAGLFSARSLDTCRLLDAGAGIGSLSAAFLDRWVAGGFHFGRIEVDAFEIDNRLQPHLLETLGRYKEGWDVVVEVKGDDFIQAAADSLQGGLFAERLPQYTHAILNPPYRKVRSDSAHRAALRQVGIETVNLYSAFVALSLSLLADRGQLVAIIPRSFCNGPYYRPFREYVLRHAAIRHMHLFASRTTAFKDDNVLQENLIVMLERGLCQGRVTVTTSVDDSFTDLETHRYAFDSIVLPDDPEHFIHVPTSPRRSAAGSLRSAGSTLEDIGVTISTGPVVDFRMREFLRALPGAGTVPLLYPGHFAGWTTNWPKLGFKKSNAILRNVGTEKWLYPNGFYCVVRRFSSKEEKRRVVAAVVRPDAFPDAEMLGFENHLNVFHNRRCGLPESLAYGLAAFLNSTMVDEDFRCFNGHTQVNATDLRMIKYPSRDALMELGAWAMRCGEPDQVLIDGRLESLSA